VTDADQVVPLTLPKQHPHARALAEASLVLAAHEHEDQQRALEALFETQGRDVFVSELMALSHPVHGLTSRTVWSEGVHALLPEADEVVLLGRFAGEPRLVSVRAADLHAHLVHRSLDGIHPPPPSKAISSFRLLELALLVRRRRASSSPPIIGGSLDAI
jgi:hypothetical protein